jgi:hypothetical protein
MSSQYCSIVGIHTVSKPIICQPHIISQKLMDEIEGDLVFQFDNNNSLI